eukprot:384019-Alexandrium_andersonii.AAC.1
MPQAIPTHTHTHNHTHTPRPTPPDRRAGMAASGRLRSSSSELLREVGGGRLLVLLPLGPAVLGGRLL